MTPDPYSHGHHDSVLKSHGARTAASSAAYLVPHLRSDMSILDIGCGPGSITLDLAEIVNEGEVIGVENVPAPLVKARAAAAERGDARTRFEEADAYHLPYADGRFDVVHAHQVLQHLSDPVAALREMNRVARTGGLVAARDADYQTMTWYPASAGMSGWLDAYRKLGHANGADPDAGRKLKAWARAAGLDPVTSTASVWCYSTPGETAWWADVWTHRALESAFAQQTLTYGLADHRGLEEMSSAWARWGADPDAWFAIVHGEILAVAG